MAASEAVTMPRLRTAQAVLDSPLHTVEHSSPRLAERLQHLQVPETSLTNIVQVARGTRLDLTTDPGSPSILQPRLLETPDLDEYKSWVGRADQAAPDLGTAPQPWTGPMVQELSQLSEAQQRDLEVAGRIYLFGDSRQVASYREVIEHLRGPFTAAVFSAQRVTIEPGATLVVHGDPAILLFEELVIHPTGQLLTYTATHATFGHLEKLEANADYPLSH